MKKRVIFVIFLMVIFTNLVSSMNINVGSPITGTFYDLSSVNVNVDFGEVVYWSIYHNGALKWNSQGSSINNQLIATEGLNTLIISATNPTTNISNSSTITFYVDTLFPSITSQTPENNSQKYRENIPFSVNYIEANLDYTKLYWKSSDSVYNEENVSSCGSGTCSKTIDFSSFSYGTNISYYFSLIDKTSKSNISSVYTFEIIACVQNWTLESSWSACLNGYHHKNYYDSKSCGNNTGKPSPLNETCCTLNCAGKSCGNDGCGGSCGTCGSNFNCVDGSCAQSTSDTNTNEQSTAIIPTNATYFLNESQLNSGSSKTLRKAGDKIKFKIKNESHSIELMKIFSNKVSIKISSNEKYANLTLNGTNKFDLTGDKYYDISVILKRLTLNEAEIFLKTANEKIPETLETKNTNAKNMSVEGNASVGMNNTAGGVIANETELKTGSKIMGSFFGTIGSIKKIPFYFIVAFVILVSGLAATTFAHIRHVRKRKKRRGYK